MSWVAAGVTGASLISSGIKYIGGNKKEKEAKAGLANLKAPFYDIQNEYYQNVNKAAEMAQGGLPAATKDYYTNQSEKGLSAGIKAITGGGGNPNDVSKIFQTYTDSIGKISSADAATHIDNIKYYQSVNKDLAGQKNIQWAINKQQPYLNTLKQLNAALKAGEATKNEAFSDALSSITSFGTSMLGKQSMSGGNKAGRATGEASGVMGRLFGNPGAGGGDTSLEDPFGDVFQEGGVHQ